MTRIGVAFGSGGARGLAHVLMIQAFEELGVSPSIISGSSIGAIVGAFYAAGFSSKELMEILENLIFPNNGRLSDFFMKSDIIRMLTMFDIQLLKSGFIKGEKIQNLIESNLKITTFEELKIPLKIVATDYWKKEEVILHKGRLIPSIRASYSLPGLFTPVKLNKKILIDGGAVNPLPYDILLGECDITVAIDVTAQRTRNETEIPPTFESLFTAYQIMQNSISQQKIKFVNPDIYIRPDIYDVRVFDFVKSKNIFRQAQPAKDELKRKLEKLLEFKTSTEYIEPMLNEDKSK